MKLGVAPASHLYDVTSGLCGRGRGALCVVGIVGNSMNVVVMTRRRVRTALDGRMERSARVGLLSLTIADILHLYISVSGRSLDALKSSMLSKSFFAARTVAHVLYLVGRRELDGLP